ncbi:MAG: DUF2589 domain-containing protein [Algoriphagus sp.]|uniref:DUF2589 domain-containing protein n=1 Tax=Algoriphagus sp. TaxID=1872435 RepID=UPI00262EE150|nr:DUF2589 domain-containing protein [Algoriphagus sp.]MDG1276050.1 DUF2589 domain-containing protein [Algoriphagus sp.]
MITPRYISELLGAPMAAIVQAEGIAARATANFIKEVGFTGVSDNIDGDYGTIRNVTFSYERIKADGNTEIAKLSVPLLTIIPIPSIQVAEAEIEFDLAMTQPESSPAPKENSKLGNLSSHRGLQLKAIFAKKPNPSSNLPVTSATSNMNVKIRLAQSELAVGMVQLLNILDSANKEK